MKPHAWGFCALLAGTVGLAHTADAEVDLAGFAAEVAVVQRELAETTGDVRADLLARYGRAAASSGRFDLAAAAYAMFLDEFGVSHPYSERIAMRLADCLFPFNYRQVDVAPYIAYVRADASCAVCMGEDA